MHQLIYQIWLSAIIKSKVNPKRVLAGAHVRNLENRFLRRNLLANVQAAKNYWKRFFSWFYSVYFNWNEIFLGIHHMIDLVNSSPNMGTFCHRERNLEFCSWKIWIWTICLTRHFTLFKTFPFGLLLVLGSGRILGILSSFAIWGRVGGMVVCGSEPAGQRLSIEGELAVIQEPALTQTARPIHIWYIYYWDHAPQYIIDTTHHTSARNLLAQYFALEDPMDIIRITPDKAWCINIKTQNASCKCFWVSLLGRPFFPCLLHLRQFLQRRHNKSVNEPLLHSQEKIAQQKGRRMW